MPNMAVQMSATIRDASGIEQAVQAYGVLDGAATLDSLYLPFGKWISDLDAASGGQVTRGRVFLSPVMPTGIKSTPDAGSRVEQTGLFGFSVNGSDKRYTAAIPAIANTALVGDRIDLDTGAGFTIADDWGNQNGVGMFGLSFTNEYGQEIVICIDALVSFRRKRKQLQRASFERP